MARKKIVEVPTPPPESITEKEALAEEDYQHRLKIRQLKIQLALEQTTIERMKLALRFVNNFLMTPTVKGRQDELITHDDVKTPKNIIDAQQATVIAAYNFLRKSFEINHHDENL